MILSDTVLDVVRRELRRISPDTEIDVEQIRSVLTEQVLKRGGMEGEKADEARKEIAKSAGKALSERSPVPLGKSLDRFMGNYWVIINQTVSDSPCAFILLPSEVEGLAHRGVKEDRVSFWLQPKDYEQDRFREAWDRIGHGGLDDLKATS